MANKKISQLNSATTPLSGAEVLPIVQSGETKKASVNNVIAGLAKLATAQTFTATQTFSSNVNIEGTNTSIATNNILNLKDLDTAVVTGQSTGKITFETSDTSNPGVNSYYEVRYTGSGGGGEVVIGTGFAGSTVADRLKIGDTGDVNVMTGNLVIGTAGKGIDFSATAGTGTSELLADYEEGTWTPVYTPDTGAYTSVTYDIQEGNYVKVGKLVTITGRIRTDAVTLGTAGGVLKITGLPFTGVGGPYGTVAIGYTASFNTTAPNQIVIYPTELVFYVTTTSSNAYNATDLKNAANSNYLFFSGVYYAA